jgi:hypothetical protein
MESQAFRRRTYPPKVMTVVADVNEHVTNLRGSQRTNGRACDRRDSDGGLSIQLEVPHRT